MTTFFHTVEIDAYKPSSAPTVFALGHGSHPHGAYALLPGAAPAAGVILASDMGYRTRSTDAGGVVAYPPMVKEAFAIDRQMSLDPAGTPVAAAWGAIDLSNINGDYDQIAVEWNSDGRPVKINRGVKSREDYGFRCTRATIGTYVGQDLLVHTALANVVRWNYTTHLGAPTPLNEPDATNILPRSDPTDASWAAVQGTKTKSNEVRNPTMAGVVAGSPGTMPTNWSTGLAAGLSRTIVGSGSEGGIPYIDVRIFGTPSATVTNIIFEPAGVGAVPAVPGQVWTLSFYLSLVAGTMTGVASSTARFTEINSSGGAITAVAGSIALPVAGALSSVRPSYTSPALVALTAFIQPFFQFITTIGAAVDFTIRIGWPQMELGSSVTPLAGALGPDGVTLAARLTEDATTNEHYVDIGGSYPIVGSSYYTQSIHARAGSRSRMELQARVTGSIVGGVCAVVADLVAGTIAVAFGTPTAFGIVPLANGWFRIWQTFQTVLAPTTVIFRTSILSPGAVAAAPSYLGDGVSGILLWGAQLEAFAIVSDGVDFADDFSVDFG